MWNRISTALVLVYTAMPSCANVQAPALWQEPALSDFNVTDGTIKRSSDDRFVVESSEMRAVLTSGRSAIPPGRINAVRIPRRRRRAG